MKVQSIARQMKLRVWASQIDDCMQSGLSVKQWCERNGVAKKTYYYRQKRVREELLEATEIGGALQLTRMTGSDIDSETKLLEQEAPIFAPLPMPQGKVSAVTVWVGGYAVDIQNGADDALIEQTLRVVSRL